MTPTKDKNHPLFKLAQQFARHKKSKILDHTIYDDVIVFVLVAGSKHKFNTEELEQQIRNFEKAKLKELEHIEAEIEDTEGEINLEEKPKKNKGKNKGTDET